LPSYGPINKSRHATSCYLYSARTTRPLERVEGQQKLATDLVENIPRVGYGWLKAFSFSSKTPAVKVFH
jgi:hypothetical protein